MLLLFVAFTSLFALLAYLLLQSPIQTPVIAVVGGRVIDGYGQAPIENGTVLIEGEKIVAVGSNAEVAVPGRAAIAFSLPEMPLLSSVQLPPLRVLQIVPSSPAAYSAALSAALMPCSGSACTV